MFIGCKVKLKKNMFFCQITCINTYLRLQTSCKKAIKEKIWAVKRNILGAVLNKKQ